MFQTKKNRQLILLANSFSDLSDGWVALQNATTQFCQLVVPIFVAQCLAVPLTARKKLLYFCER